MNIENGWKTQKGLNLDCYLSRDIQSSANLDNIREWKIGEGDGSLEDCEAQQEVESHSHN